jgi:hypothetical protein
VKTWFGGPKQEARAFANCALDNVRSLKRWPSVSSLLPTLRLRSRPINDASQVVDVCQVMPLRVVGPSALSWPRRVHRLGLLLAVTRFRHSLLHNLSYSLPSEMDTYKEPRRPPKDPCTAAERARYCCDCPEPSQRHLVAHQGLYTYRFFSFIRTLHQLLPHQTS